MCHSSTQFQDVPGSGIFGRSVSWTSIPCLRHGDFRIFQTKRPSLKGFSAGAIRGLVAWRLYNVVCSRRSEAVTISEGNGLAITCYPSALAAHKKIRKQHENSKQQVATARETMARSSSNLLVGEEGSHVKLKHADFLQDTSFSRFVLEPLAQSSSSLFFWAQCSAMCIQLLNDSALLATVHQASCCLPSAVTFTYESFAASLAIPLT